MRRCAFCPNSRGSLRQRWPALPHSDVIGAPLFRNSHTMRPIVAGIVGVHFHGQDTRSAGVDVCRQHWHTHAHAIRMRESQLICVTYVPTARLNTTIALWMKDEKTTRTAHTRREAYQTLTAAVVMFTCTQLGLDVRVCVCDDCGLLMRNNVAADGSDCVLMAIPLPHGNDPRRSRRRLLWVFPARANNARQYLPKRFVAIESDRIHLFGLLCILLSIQTSIWHTGLVMIMMDTTRRNIDDGQWTRNKHA